MFLHNGELDAFRLLVPLVDYGSLS